MPKLHTLIFLFSLFGLTACSNWAIEGLGGMAEHHQQTLSPIKAGKPLGPEHGLRFDLELASRHLDMLVLEGAELCFPATVVQAKIRQNRISRELQGDLEYDAANDIIIQRNLLARLERQLDYVKQNDICILPIIKDKSIEKGEKKPNVNSKNPTKLSNNNKGKRPGTTSKYIASLLNSDNQFAVDSSELNPKYLLRLAEAVKLLVNIPYYNLLITGHADITGTQNRNQQLAIERAEQVGRYLQVLGLPASRLQFHANGSDDPLFIGNEPQIRLVNRRVSIELIETNTSRVKKGK